MAKEKHPCVVCGFRGIGGESVCLARDRWFCAKHYNEGLAYMADPGHRKVADVALSQCLSVNKDNPLAVAETIKEAFEALEALLSRVKMDTKRQKWFGNPVMKNLAIEQGLAVLAKANQNRDIETVCSDNNRYSPSWQHTRNQPGSKF